MYSKAEKSNIKREFWTSFGLYMKPIRSSEGLKINWVNYKTGIKNIYFRMDADTKKCSIAVEIKDSGYEREGVFEKFISVKNIFHSICGHDWVWVKDIFDEDGTPLSKIYCEKNELNVLKKEDWPEIISFIKSRIIKLDEFWTTVKFNFE